MSTAASVLTDVRIFDGVSLSAPTRVGIADGLFADPDVLVGADIVDCAGATLLPGLIDAHVHLLTPDDMAALAVHGVTTAFDMACWPPERVASFRGGVPDIRSAGIPAIGPGGPHSHMPGMPAEAILTDAAQAEPFVARRVAEGSDYIKVVVDDDLLSQDTVDAVVAAGRAHGKLTVAHAATLASYRRAVQAGADVLTHVPRDGVLDAETIAAMAERGQIAVPTLAVMEARLKAAGGDYGVCRASVAALRDAGVPVLAGTDSFSGIPLVAHGTGLHHELELLVEAGLGEAEALRAAGVLAARHFGLDDRGAVVPGLRADAVLVHGDPLAEIGAVRRIQRIWAAGEAVVRP